MKFQIEPKIFQKWPEVKIGVVVAFGLNNTRGQEQILKLLHQEEKKKVGEFKDKDIKAQPFIACWLKTYQEFGASAKKYPSSIESLLARIAKGGRLPDINPLVNLYNFLSLKHLLPFGGEDLDKIKGNVWLTFAKGDEKGKYIGSDKLETALPGEVIYKDDLGFICRRWNWREADRTKFTPQTKNAVLVAEALPPVGREELEKAIKELSDLVRKFLGGEIKVFILDKDNPSAGFDFQAVVKKEKREVEKRVEEKQPKIKPAEPAESKWSLPVPKNFLRYQLQKAIAEAINSVQGSTLEPEEVYLEHPENEEHGDYATNVALVQYRIGVKKLSHKTKGFFFNPDEPNDIIYPTPMSFAEAIVKELKNNETMKQLSSEIQALKPGFINISIKTDWLVSQLWRVIKEGDGYGKSQVLVGKKIMVEYTDPNPFKEFHIGHLYSNIVGESLARLFEVQGALVKRANYQGDVGLHVAKAIWGMRKEMEKYREIATVKDLQRFPLRRRMFYWQGAYARGAIAYEENKQAQEEIKDINYLVYIVAQEYLKEREEWKPQVDYHQYIKGRKFNREEVRELYEEGKDCSLDYFEEIYKKLDTNYSSTKRFKKGEKAFDYYYFESLVGEYGVKLVKEYLEKGIFQKSKGAIVFPGEKYGLHTRVFINSLGLPTYEAKDLGLVQTKYKDFKYDRSLIVTGSEIDVYFQVVLAALREINPSLWEKTKHISHGMVRFAGGKISSRAGNILTGGWLIRETIKRAENLAMEKGVEKNERGSDFLKDIHMVGGQKKREKITEKIGLGAVKYSFLKYNIGANIIFNFDESVSLQGNSGPYLQYTYARARSVLRKSQIPSTKLQTPKPRRVRGTANSKFQIPNSKFNSEELAILRWFYRFPEVVLEAAENYSPNLICNFLYELAQRYNTFYSKHRILNLKSPASALEASQLPTCPPRLTPSGVGRRVRPSSSRDASAGRQNSRLENFKTNFRLLLTSATAQVLKNGLQLLGIKTVARM